MSRAPAQEVSLSLTGRRVRIDAAPGSEVFAPLHRIFLTNTLEFALDEEAAAYICEADTTPITSALDALRYLQDSGFAVKLNKAAADVANNALSTVNSLKTAATTGARLKQMPVRSLSVPGLKRPLKPYQVPAVAHLVGVDHAADFSVPGSGKTTIALSAFMMLRAARKVDTLVVVAPRAAFMPWEEEVAATLGRRMRSMRIVGSKAKRLRLYRAVTPKSLILLTYQMATNDVADLGALLRRHKVMLVLDESHNIKRFEGGQWAEALISLAPLATKRVILTGTPTPNSILDLWSQIAFLWPTSTPLGDRYVFKHRAAEDDATALESTRAAFYPFYWRITKDDLHLPKPHYHRIALQMTKYQQAIYDVIAARVLADLVAAPQERLKLRFWRRARMVRLLQAASNPSLLARHSTEFRIPPLDASGLPIASLIERYNDFEMPSKLSAVKELTERLVQAGRPVLIWTAFVHNILTLQELLSDLQPGTLYGAVPRDDEEDEDYNRESIIRSFKEGRYRVLIANPSACAESVSLHRICRDAIYLDRTFNAAHYQQSLDRVHRIGLDPHDQVNYYILQSTTSIDEVVDSRLATKLARMERLLNQDFTVLDLDSPTEEFSEEAEEEADFAALLGAIREQQGSTKA